MHPHTSFLLCNILLFELILSSLDLLPAVPKARSGLFVFLLSFLDPFPVWSLHGSALETSGYLPATACYSLILSCLAPPLKPLMIGLNPGPRGQNSETGT